MKSSARNSLKRLTSLNWSEWKKSLLSCSRIARSSVDCLVSFIFLFLLCAVRRRPRASPQPPGSRRRRPRCCATAAAARRVALHRLGGIVDDQTELRGVVVGVVAGHEEVL